MFDHAQAEWCGQFREWGCRALGGKMREQLQTIADESERQWKP